jgi:molybdate transport system substrate-binding protein
MLLRYFLCILLLAAAGCGGGNDVAARGPVTVFAASSLAQVFEELDSGARFNFAGSDALALQIREGAPADVYAAASTNYPDELREAGLVEEPRVFATNRLVLIIPRGNPAGIETVLDAAGLDVRLVVAAEGVPARDYTRTVLANLGLEQALDNVVSEEDDVRSVAAKVALGEADAGFVYATDAAPLGDDVRVIEIPAEAQPPIEYSLAVVSGSSNEEAAQAFVDLILSEEGRRALEAAGFGTP